MINKSIEIQPAFSEKNIPIIFSVNDYFTPCLAVEIVSILENSSPKFNYDFLVLIDRVSKDNQDKVLEVVKNHANATIRFIKVSEFLSDYTLYTENRPSITKEAYFRLLIPTLLCNYEKALYLDADMVVLKDITSLFEIELEESQLLASTRDVDGIGCCYKPKADRKQYMTKFLGFECVEDYFISGVLLLNLIALRKEFPGFKLMEIASSKSWKFHDQDVLNIIAKNRVKFVPMAWDVMRDCGNVKYLPKELKEEAYAALREPYIVHYAGRFGKPWVSETVYGAKYFWELAKKTPFYNTLVDRLTENEPQNSLIQSLNHSNDQENEILVSVIIPIYNAEKFIDDSLSCVINQTLSSIEIICVDDGSSDNSLQKLKEYAEKDARIQLVTQLQKGAGAARNTGMKYARGRYLSFLDADDFFDPTMLEKAYLCAEKNSADMVIFKVREFNVQTQKTTDAPWHLREEYLPDDEVFNCSDIKDHIFNFTKGCVWNKLFRRQFVLEEKICFQEIKRANDILFTDTCLVAAKTIALLKEALIVQRVGMTTNLQATNANSPFDFYSAFLALKHELEKRQVFALYKKSFANAAIRDFGYCLMKLDKKPEQKRLLRFLKGKNGLKQLALDGFEAKDFYFKSDYDTYALLKSKKPSEFILMKVIRCLQEKGIRYTMVRVWEHLCCKKGS